MRVLIGCECSGVVRRAFRARGHDAWSCDLGPADDGSPFHYQRDVMEVLKLGWDRFITHPPCTFLNSAGLHWIARGRIEEDGRHRRDHQQEALEFFAAMMNAPVDKIAVENPIGCVSRRLGRLVTGGRWVVKAYTEKKTCAPQQIIQPYQFGDDASKATCLWLKGLEPLVLDPALHVAPRAVCAACGKVGRGALAVDMFSHGCPECGAEASRIRPRWANQTDSGQNKLPPSEDRAKLRSETYPGIARAMAEQWG